MAQSPPPLINTPPRLKKRSGNKGWLAAGLILLFIVLIALVAIPFTISPGARDLPEPPDDSDLQSRAEPIPDEENAYHYYILAVNAMELSKEEEEQLYELEETDETFVKLLEELIEKNAPAIESYRQAIAAAQSQAPVLSSYEEDSGIANVDTSDLLYLISVDFWSRFYAGEELGAIQEAMDMAALGSKLMQSHGVTHYYVEGAYVLFYGLDEFIGLVARSELPAEQLRPFADALDTLYDDGSGLADAIIEDYTLQLAYLLELVKAEIPMDEETPELLKRLAEFAQRQAASSYHVNRMRTDLVECLRPLIANADKPLSDMSLDDLNEAENFKLTDAFSAFRPKSASRMIVLQFLPFLREPIEEKCYTNSLVAIAEATLALKLYLLDHGALPQTLDELVPDYLGRVPLDDMDGEPIRYDPERKVLYSVGVDLVDSTRGQSDLDDSGDDLVWIVDFDADLVATETETTQEQSAP